LRGVPITAGRSDDDIIGFNDHGFFLRCHGHPRDAEYLPIVFIGFIDDVLAYTLDGDDIRVGVTFAKRIVPSSLAV
jgi:hypothetical protein